MKFITKTISLAFIIFFVGTIIITQQQDNFSTTKSIEPLIGQSNNANINYYISILHMRIQTPNRIATYIANVPLTPFKAHLKMLPRADVPRFLLWKRDMLSPVRNQGECGACWAFGLTSTMADRLMIQTGGLFSENLSVQELLRCFDPTGCEGGSPEDAAMWMASELKDMSEYPSAFVSEGPFMLNREKESDYKQLRSTVVAGKCEVSEGLKVGIIKDSVFSCAEFINEENYDQQILQKNIENMKRALYKEGPLYCAMTVYEDLFRFDGTSVYKHTKNSSVIGGHCIEIIGYCEKGIDTRFRTDGYWVCRNSWSSAWPLKSLTPGYFMVRMGYNECGIESRVGGCTPYSIPYIEQSNVSINELLFTDFHTYYKNSK